MKLFRKNKETDIQECNLYVVDAGTYGGDYLVLIQKQSNDLTFLVLPEIQKRTIEITVFQRGIDNGVVKFLEKLPKSIFKTCKLQFDKINIKDELRQTNKNY